MLLFIILQSVFSTPVFNFNINDFECIDDTQFRHYISDTDFVINNCPPGLCFTRSPPNQNPCIGKELALQIDKVIEPVLSDDEEEFVSEPVLSDCEEESTDFIPLGTQFITGPCTRDSDCAPFAGQLGCCERNQNICRAVLSLTPNVQFCKDGRTPNFD